MQKLWIQKTNNCTTWASMDFGICRSPGANPPWIQRTTIYAWLSSLFKVPPHLFFVKRFSLNLHFLWKWEEFQDNSQQKTRWNDHRIILNHNLHYYYHFFHFNMNFWEKKWVHSKHGGSWIALFLSSLKLREDGERCYSLVNVLYFSFSYQKEARPPAKVIRAVDCWVPLSSQGAQFVSQVPE